MQHIMRTRSLMDTVQYLKQKKTLSSNVDRSFREEIVISSVHAICSLSYINDIFCLSAILIQMISKKFRYVICSQRHFLVMFWKRSKDEYLDQHNGKPDLYLCQEQTPEHTTLCNTDHRHGTNINFRQSENPSGDTNTIKRKCNRWTCQSINQLTSKTDQDIPTMLTTLMRLQRAV